MGVYGQTLSGKSTFCKRLVSEVFGPAGRSCLVLDDTGEPWPGADFVTDNPEEFLRVCKLETNCCVIVDEGGTTIGPNSPLFILTTRMRKNGHNVIAIAHRAVQLPLTMRGSFGAVCMFNSSIKDAKDQAEIFNDDGLLAAPDLTQGEYLYKVRFQPLIRANIFTR